MVHQVLGYREHASARQVSGCGHEHARVVRQLTRHQRGVFEVRYADGYIDLFGNQVTHPVFHQQRHLHQGVQACELGDQGHQVALPQWARARHPQRTAHLLLELAGDLRHVAQRAVNLLGFEQHHLAHFGQRQLSRRALDEARTQISLQPGQLAREDRLAAAQPGCGSTDTACADDGREGGEELGVEHGCEVIVASKATQLCFIRASQATPLPLHLIPARSPQQPKEPLHDPIFHIRCPGNAI